MTSFRRPVPTRFLINQFQIITFLNLKSDIIENLMIEFRGIVLPVPSNQIKVTFIIILPFNFNSVIKKLKENVGGLLTGRAKGYDAPPLKLLGGSAPPPPPPPYTHTHTLRL